MCGVRVCVWGGGGGGGGRDLRGKTKTADLTL